MQIVVNHVTRMRGSRICVAGIEKDTLEHIRPVTPSSDLITRKLLRAEGGPFGPGALVDIGQARPEGQRPEIEDHGFVTSQARHVEDLSHDAYLAALNDVRRESVEDAFGAGLREVHPQKFAVPAGDGDCSLAVIAVRRPKLHVDSWAKLLIDIDDGFVAARLRVTDVRF